MILVIVLVVMCFAGMMLASDEDDMEDTLMRDVNDHNPIEHMRYCVEYANIQVCHSVFYGARLPNKSYCLCEENMKS